MNNNSPLVSFIIPTHNRANILKECLQSVVSQTYKNIEVIVVNDHSTDDTLNILEEYQSNYGFFRFINNDGKGVSAARNLGIRIAKGDYIAFMDDDDICELFRIEEQMKPIIESGFKFNFIISSFSVFSKTGQTIKIYDYLLKTNSVGYTVRWLVKRDLLLEAGLFDTSQPNLEEVELFFRLKGNAQIFFSTVPVVKVRESQVSLTKDNEKMIQGILRLLELHSDKMGWYEKNAWLIHLCKKYIEQEHYENFNLYYKQLAKEHFRLNRLALLLSYKIKSLLPSIIYDRIYSKFEGLINGKNKTYPVSIGL
ncbi:MAG: glycosyltransferase family 2 protein [Sphingobacteriaceae bacterium]|nr:glycosyltransferase family 2 protein [Sphingobacteriaceae bacterium]